jgi:hypothetical protein
MESFFEKFAKQKVNFAKEVNTLDLLLRQKDSLHNTVSVHSVLNDCYLKIDNKYRNNTINYEDLIQSSGLYRITDNVKNVQCYDENFSYHILSFDDYRAYSECLYSLLTNSEVKNIITEKRKIYFYYEFLYDNYQAILTNIRDTIEKLNHKIFENPNGFSIIVEKDYAVTQAAEIIGDKYELGEQLYLFHHYSLKGNLNEKSDILCRLYKYYEGIKDTLKANALSSLTYSIGILSNKTDTRHAPAEKEIAVLAGKNEQEMEEIYDTLFSLYLIAIITADYYENKKSVADKYVEEFK